MCREHYWGQIALFSTVKISNCECVCGGGGSEGRKGIHSGIVKIMYI